jgi:hypothetical protein
MNFDLIRTAMDVTAVAVGLAGATSLYVGHRRRQVAREATLALNLNPITLALVDDFSQALKRKLAKAETVHGFSTEWAFDDWELNCREKLSASVKKGDPLDVAAYAAFCWARTWRTTPPISHSEA